jgi:hypothetical protein
MTADNTTAAFDELLFSESELSVSEGSQHRRELLSEGSSIVIFIICRCELTQAVIVHAMRTPGAAPAAPSTPRASSSFIPSVSRRASATRASSQRRKHSELEKEMDLAMKRELAIYEKKMKLAEEDSIARKEESCALCLLEEKKLELEKEKVLREEKREEEKLKLEREKIAMGERERKSTLLIALVNAGKTEEEIASLLKHI